jgi:hypothetical protein
VQNQGTLDGSPVAQAILSFMESRNEWTGLVSDLYAKLEVEAEELNINVKRDKMWPKSALWLSRRIRDVVPLLRALGVDVATSTSRKAGTEITITKVPAGRDPDPEPDGGSKNRDTATATATENPAEESASGNGGSRGSKSGYSGFSLSRTGENEAEKPSSNSAEKGTAPKVHRNTASTATAKKRRLSTEEAQHVQQLMAGGMKPGLARDEVLGEGAT